MKNKKRTTPTVGSRASAEVKQLLSEHKPPISVSEAAKMTGMTEQTIRATINDERIASPNIISSLAIELGLSAGVHKRLLDLREQDMKNRKVKRALLAGESGGDTQLATLLESLDESQLAAVRKFTIQLAEKKSEAESKKAKK